MSLALRSEKQPGHQPKDRTFSQPTQSSQLNTLAREMPEWQQSETRHRKNRERPGSDCPGFASRYAEEERQHREDVEDSTTHRGSSRHGPVVMQRQVLTIQELQLDLQRVVCEVHRRRIGKHSSPHPRTLRRVRRSRMAWHCPSIRDWHCQSINLRATVRTVGLSQHTQVLVSTRTQSFSREQKFRAPPARPRSAAPRV